MTSIVMRWLLVAVFAVAGGVPVDGTLVPASAAAPRWCDVPSRTPVQNPIVVSLPPAAPFTVGEIVALSFRSPPVADPVWRLHYLGFMYLMPLAARAAVDGDRRALRTMVNQLLAFHSADPDPDSNLYGWDEGTAQRRLQIENCLYSATHDSRLVPGMAADVAVQLGWRYYGPPLHQVHNHGVMANLRIVVAGELLGRSGWITTGMSRLANESVVAFSAHGMSWEQSAEYQVFNVRLWQTAEALLAGNARTEAAARTVRDGIRKATSAVAWLTEPDGRLVQIGDSDRVSGRSTPAAGTVFRDDAAGYVIGRWSWTDPTTTYYTLRCGLPRRAHGQPDRGGLTWSAAGTRILVDPGRFGYSPSPWSRWRMTPTAHNVAVPVGDAYRESGRAWVSRESVSAETHRWLLEDNLYGGLHTRAVAVSPNRLTVTDGYEGHLRQYWHLDPTWELVRTTARAAVFTNGRHALTIRTNGAISWAVRASTRPVAGWVYPLTGVRTPAYELVVRSVADSLTTTFAVT